jgi:hypothetical protein
MSIPPLRRTFALGCLVAAAACASPPAPEAAQPTNRTMITDAEIPTTGTESAYDLIQRIRPEYLRPRPTQTYMGAKSNEAPPPALVFNGQRLGDVGDLRQVPAPSLSYVRYYSIEEGKRKFGMQYGGGVIEIRYRLP